MSGSSDNRFLPYGHQLVDDDDIAEVSAVLRGDFLTTGPTVAQFEQAFAECAHARHAIACSSGTAALHLAAMAIGLGPGDVAVVPSLTFLATANAVRFVGAEVIFADVDPATGMLTADTLRTALAVKSPPGRIKAVLPVHLGGMVADIEAIGAVARASGLTVIEDACHALGATSADGERAGACAQSALAAFSTHPVKTITTGEGGIVTTNDATLAERARRLRNHGMEHDPAHWTDAPAGHEGDQPPAPWYYEMTEIGYNYRLTDIGCALGLSQLKKLDRFLKRRTELAARYDHLLASLAPYVKVPTRPAQGTSAWHLYAVQIDFADMQRRRSDVMRSMRAAGIGTQVHYIPIHRQPYYRRRYGERDLPGANAYYDRTLSLPLHPAMEDRDVHRVVGALKAALGLA